MFSLVFAFSVALAVQVEVPDGDGFRQLPPRPPPSQDGHEQAVGYGLKRPPPSQDGHEQAVGYGLKRPATFHDSAELLKDFFNDMDFNKDGKISAEDLVQFDIHDPLALKLGFQQIDGGSTSDKGKLEDAKSLIAKYDADGDSALSFEEFTSSELAELAKIRRASFAQEDEGAALGAEDAAFAEEAGCAAPNSPMPVDALPDCVCKSPKSDPAHRQRCLASVPADKSGSFWAPDTQPFCKFSADVFKGADGTCTDFMGKGEGRDRCEKFRGAAAVAPLDNIVCVYIPMFKGLRQTPLSSKEQDEELENACSRVKGDKFTCWHKRDCDFYACMTYPWHEGHCHAWREPERGVDVKQHFEFVVQDIRTKRSEIAVPAESLAETAEEALDGTCTQEGDACSGCPDAADCDNESGCWRYRTCLGMELTAGEQMTRYWDTCGANC